MLPALATAAPAPPPDPLPGVPLELARQRAAAVRDLRYELVLQIPARPQTPIRGRATLRFELADPAQPLVLDFDAPGADEARVVVNGTPVRVRAVNGHLVIPAAALRRGANRVQIAFRAGDAPLNRAPDLLYTLFVPARARLAIPCFDQPDLKARWSLTLEHPAAWQSVANGAELARAVRGARVRVRVRFAETAPLPTYLLAFAAGALQIEQAQRDGRMLRLFHRENDRAKLEHQLGELFDQHAQALAELERYTGIPYPFGKFDIVLLPSFLFGGMEHAGAIFYRAESLLLEPSATQDQLLARANVIAHETAHMWFGDLVTMRWFDDVWTKEVFANFMADKLIQPRFPQLRHDLRFFGSHHGDAYAVDRSAGSNPIRQPLANLDGAGSLYGPIIYEKSPVVMRQLEALLGEAAFRAGVREYLRRHAFGNATWDDLIAALAGHSPQDLRHWSRMWIDEPGRPQIRSTLQRDAAGPARLVLTQADSHGRDRTWPQQLHVALGCGATRRLLVADLHGASLDLSERLGDCVPDWVLAGGDGWAYGEMVLDEHSRAWLLARLETIEDPLDRGVAWSALWEDLLAARITPAAWWAMARRVLAHETQPQLVEAWLSDLQTVWWRFLVDTQRTARAADLEGLLQERLAADGSPILKAAWFNALRSVATTPAALARLRALWAREATIEGLPLGETDETALAQALALRDLPDAEAILDAQQARLANPDRRARFAFVRAAVSPDAARRARWWQALREPAGRRHETWVLEGLRLMHHPLRAQASRATVPEALALLREVHTTGALFFDAGWVQAVLGGHGTPETAQMVEQFLAGLPPDYPPRVRAVVLQAADLLQRAQRARCSTACS
ncbi:MAG: ERAP1-like C-terminal domain-containing protein [Piscinibacter sp.]|nr:ERAP1-like C-terminal domain-containing protein [Piscinibacter sp.]